jgi:hypothetical protein
MSATAAVEVRISPQLRAAGASVGAGTDELEDAVAKALEGLCDELGVEGSCDVAIVDGADERRALSVLVNGVQCRYPRRWEFAPWLFRGSAQLPCYERTGPLTDLVAACAGGDKAGAVVAALVAQTVARRIDLLGALAADEERPSRATILVQPAYLDALLEGDVAAAPFPSMRQLFFERCGIHLPRLTFREDPTLPARGFAFEGLGARTPGVIGLPASAALVPDSDAPAGGMGASDPFKETPARVVEGGDPRDTGYGALTLMTRALMSVALYRVDLLVTPASTHLELNRLGVAFPQLAEAADEYIPLSVLTWIRRRLVVEGVAVRDLRRIVQLLLDERFRTGSLSEGPELLRRLRLASRSQITRDAAGGADKIAPYRVPTDAQDLFELADAADSTGDGQVLVTSPSDRERVRELVAPEWPSLPVVAEDELLPGAVSSSKAKQETASAGI